jgi:hypothetical protein
MPFKRIDKTYIHFDWLDNVTKERIERKGYILRAGANAVLNKILDTNAEKDCVVAYLKSDFVGYALIKVSRGYKAIMYLEDEVFRPLKSFNTFRVTEFDLDAYMELKEKYKEKFVIVNQELNDDLIKEMLLNKLQNG